MVFKTIKGTVGSASLTPFDPSLISMGSYCHQTTPLGNDVFCLRETVGFF